MRLLLAGWVFFAAVSGGGCGSSSPSGPTAPQVVSGTLKICEDPNTDWAWVNSSYRHYVGGYVPGRGAGLRNAEFSVGGDDRGMLMVPDEYWTYLQFSLPTAIAGLTFTQFDLVLQSFADTDPGRDTTRMKLRAVTEAWATEELASGFTGLRWASKPVTQEVATVDAPKTGEPYMLNLIPVIASNGLANGLALSPTDTFANFNHFVSCGGDKANWPVVNYTGTRLP